MFFCFFHGRKCFFVKISFVFHGRQAFFLHFTIFTRGRRAFFFYFPLIWCFRDAVFPPWGSYWTHIGQSAARTSSSWKGASMGLCRWPRPRGDYSCPTCESIARQRQRVCRAIARRLALDSSRLKINRRLREKLNFATPRLEFCKYCSECCSWLTLYIVRILS